MFDVEEVEKDGSGLSDFHKMPDIYGFDIDKVGINRFRIPLKFRHKDGTVMNHDGIASMYIHFPKGKAGINMSRLYEILQEEADQSFVSHQLFKKILTRYRRDMRDNDDESLFKAAYLKFKFNYALKQPALKSPKEGWQYYVCEMEGRKDSQGKIRMFLTTHYEYSSTCPCSLSMSKQYETEHALNLTSEGNGMAVPHSQRSQAKVTVEIPFGTEFFVEDLVELIRKAIPTETQSFAKRVDEQAFAVLNAQNPMFVEHATRRLSRVLNADKRVLDWVVSVEHWESLHSHNAVAVIRKGIPGGLS
ncbi:MAG TPA: GTP cyclohydrolase FolE2 [Candidatus Omnitrophota bacterium]|nr:GTP cyclohydrolase FolE2 [Candidatus Omnitrophota bacterium]